MKVINSRMVDVIARHSIIFESSLAHLDPNDVDHLGFSLKYL